MKMKSFLVLACLGILIQMIPGEFNHEEHERDEEKEQLDLPRLKR